MAQMTIRINGYAYTVGCEDGQEAHLQAMAEAVEKRIDSIKALGGQSGESRLLVLAALLMAAAQRSCWRSCGRACRRKGGVAGCGRSPNAPRRLQPRRSSPSFSRRGCRARQASKSPGP